MGKLKTRIIDCDNYEDFVKLFLEVFSFLGRIQIVSVPVKLGKIYQSKQYMISNLIEENPDQSKTIIFATEKIYSLTHLTAKFSNRRKIAIIIFSSLRIKSLRGKTAIET
jgi:hypothetical protein